MTMAHRAPVVAEFLARLENAFETTLLETKSSAAIGRIFAALRNPSPLGDTAPQRLPVCTYIGEALDFASAKSPALAALADAFAFVEPSLSWKQRPSGGPNSSANWPEGHANATIVGPDGVEDRGDLAIGVSLLAPKVRYPDHNHGPEEVYLLLSPGRFQHGQSGWFEPGTGNTLYNEPNIRHAMASDEAPLLAVWCLWIGETGR